MAVTGAEGALAPVVAVALVGVLGVGAQWLAWRLSMPAIVLMLAAGVLVGPVAGIFEPLRDIGPLTGPLISLAVAVILFEGGLTLNLHGLRGAAKGGVRRLVFLGAPLGWLFSTLALRYGAGLSWEAASVFGGIMIVTGPTVIAPLLRQARLKRRPAALLQWEAIVNDPIGALAAVLAFEVVLVTRTAESWTAAAGDFAVGIVVAGLAGGAAGWGLARAFRRALVPEFMKVPVLFAALLGVFAATDSLLHESGLLAVTVMGIVIANADLPSFAEIRRFKEHATVLLVSGVFILLAASLDFSELARLDWRAALFVAAVVLVARPVTVLLALMRSDVPWPERVLVATTGPRGVVLVAVAGLFGERLAALGVADGALIGPLAFALVAATVVLHGFTLAPVARALGLTGGELPGVLVVGAAPWSVALAKVLQEAGLPVLVTDPNPTHMRSVWAAGLPGFHGDILSEAAEHGVELVAFGTVVAVSDNDAYNTLVCTDLGPEFGREHVFQIQREKSERQRYALPATLGGRGFGDGSTEATMARRYAEGWSFAAEELSGEPEALARWREAHPDAVPLAVLPAGGQIRFVNADEKIRANGGATLFAMRPPAAGA